MSNRNAKIRASHDTRRGFSDADVATMLSAGATTQEIADRFDCADRSILRIIQKIGMTPNVKLSWWTTERVAELQRLWAILPKLTIPAIATQLGTCKNAVIGKSNRLGLPARDTATSRRNSPEIREQMRAMLIDGARPADVSYALGTNHVTAQSMRCRLGLPKLVGQVRNKNLPGPKITLPPMEAPQMLPDDRQTALTFPIPRARPSCSCAWLDDGPRPRTYIACEAVAVHGKPYCSEHARRAFIAVTPLRMRVAA